jgi:hypothetical protein
MCWSNVEGAGVFDSDQAELILEGLVWHILCRVMRGPHLDLASTGELTDELDRRRQVILGSHPLYRPVDPR